MLPIHLLDEILDEGLHANTVRTNGAERWRQAVNSPDSPSLYIRYHALLI